MSAPASRIGYGVTLPFGPMSAKHAAAESEQAGTELPAESVSVVLDTEPSPSRALTISLPSVLFPEQVVPAPTAIKIGCVMPALTQAPVVADPLGGASPAITIWPQ